MSSPGKSNAMPKCGALTKAGTKCNNPAGGCRWHHSGTKVWAEVDWATIVKQLRKMDVDIQGIAEYEQFVGTGIPSYLYQKYFPWLKTWSLSGLTRALKANAKIERIVRDIDKAFDRAWASPKNRNVVERYRKANVSRARVKDWYMRMFSGLLLSSTDIEGLLNNGELGHHPVNDIIAGE